VEKNKDILIYKGLLAIASAIDKLADRISEEDLDSARQEQTEQQVYLNGSSTTLD